MVYADPCSTPSPTKRSRRSPHKSSPEHWEEHSPSLLSSADRRQYDSNNTHHNNSPTTSTCTPSRCTDDNRSVSSASTAAGYSRPTIAFHRPWKIYWASIGAVSATVVFLCAVGDRMSYLGENNHDASREAITSTQNAPRMALMVSYDDDDAEELDMDDDGWNSFEDSANGNGQEYDVDKIDEIIDMDDEMNGYQLQLATTSLEEVENDDEIDNQQGVEEEYDLMESEAADSADDDDKSRPYYLVYASDEASRPGVEASIRSVQAHASGPVEFLYVGEKPLRDMSSDVRVHFLELSAVAEKYDLAAYANDRFLRHGKNEGLNQNPANYVRFAMHQLLPKQSKAMWIDADTIVECDVVQLLKSALTDSDSTNTIAAVPRDGFPVGLTRRGRKYAEGINTTFNAGMYIVDLNRWREQHISEMIKRIADVNRKYGLYLKGSQPPLALIVGEKFEHLPRSWNVKMADLDTSTDERPSLGGKLSDWMCLMHWSGPNKPWNRGHEDRIHPEYWLTWGSPVEPDDLNQRKKRKNKVL